MDEREPNLMVDASMDPMQTKNQVNHVAVSLCAFDRPANFGQLSALDGDSSLV